MKRLLLIIILLTACTPQYVYQSNVSIEPYFCPKSDCSNGIITEIHNAKETIDIAIYSFTHEEIQIALEEAHNRGVKIRILFDNTQAVGKSSVDEYLISRGLDVRYDKGKVMHNKIMIIDGKTVITGSFNYSKNADTSNDENFVIIKDTYLAQRYETYFEGLWDKYK